MLCEPGRCSASLSGGLLTLSRGGGVFRLGLLDHWYRQPLPGVKHLERIYRCQVQRRRWAANAKLALLRGRNPLPGPIEAQGRNCRRSSRHQPRPN